MICEKKLQKANNITCIKNSYMEPTVEHGIQAY